MQSAAKSPSGSDTCLVPSSADKVSCKHFASSRTACVEIGDEMDAEDMQLANIIFTGDSTGWNTEDWDWDPLSFTASPRVPPAAERAGVSSKGVFKLATHIEQQALSKEKPSAETLDCGGNLLTSKPAPEQKRRAPSPSSSDEAATIHCSEAAHTHANACQADGCGHLLAGLSLYQQRCRVCEVHIKMPEFLRDNRLQRFCQQCGRCHELSAFKDSQRSCRKQLAKHNASRKKRRAQKAAAAYAGSASASAAMTSSSQQAEWISAPSPFQLPQPKVTELGHWPGASLKQPPLCSCGTRGPPLTAACLGEAPLAQGPAGEFPAQDAALGLLLGPIPKEEFTLSSQSSQDLPARGQRMSDSYAAYCSAAASADLPLNICEATAENTDISSTGFYPVQEHALFPQQALGPLPYPAPMHLPHSPASSVSASFDKALALMGHRPTAAARQPPRYLPENLAVRLSIKLFSCTPEQLPGDLQRQLTGWLNSTRACAEGYLRPGCVHLLLHAHVPAAAGRQAAKGGVRAVVAHLAAQPDPVWHSDVMLLELNGDFALIKDGRLVYLGSSPLQGAVTRPPADAPLTEPLSTQGKSRGDASLAEQHMCKIVESESKGSGTIQLDSTEVGKVKGFPGVALEGLVPQVDGIWPIAVAASSFGRTASGYDSSVSSAAPAGVRVRLSGLGIVGPGRVLLCRAAGRYIKIQSTCCEPTDNQAIQAGAQYAQQTLDINLPSGLPTGLTWLEVQSGSMLSRSVPLLMAPSAELAAELNDHCRALSAADGGKEGNVAVLEDLFADLGPLVSQHACGNSLLQFSSTAARLMQYACDASLPELAFYLLSATGSASVMPPPAGGLTLLHRCVRSGTMDVLDVLLDWGDLAGHSWQADVAGPLGLSPIHLAAMAADGGATARKLLTRCSPGPTAWLAARTADGATPADFAARMGEHELVQELTAVAQLATQVEGLQTRLRTGKVVTGAELLQADKVSAPQSGSMRQALSSLPPAELSIRRSKSNGMDVANDEAANNADVKRAEVGGGSDDQALDALSAGNGKGSLAHVHPAPARRTTGQPGDAVGTECHNTHKVAAAKAGGLRSAVRKQRRNRTASPGKCNRGPPAKATGAAQGSIMAQSARGERGILQGAIAGPLLPVIAPVPCAQTRSPEPP